MTLVACHQLKDPAKLTPYEVMLYELRQKGLTYQQMSEALGGKSNAKSIASRFKIIKEKLEVQCV